jgi:hypothetical protein
MVWHGGQQSGIPMSVWWRRTTVWHINEHLVEKEGVSGGRFYGVPMSLWWRRKAPSRRTPPFGQTMPTFNTRSRAGID